MLASGEPNFAVMTGYSCTEFACTWTATSNMFSAPIAFGGEFSPAFFIVGKDYVAARHADGTLIGKPNMLPGVTSRPAQPGEIIELYGTGFGPFGGAYDTQGNLINQNLLSSCTGSPTTSGLVITCPDVGVVIGGEGTTVEWAGSVGEWDGRVALGLYQVNVMVPPNLPDGDFSVMFGYGGYQSQAGVYITVQQ